MPGYVRHHRYRELFKYPGSSVWWMFIPNPAGGKALRESTGQRDDVAAHKIFLARVRKDPLDGSEEAPQRGLNDALVARLEWLESNRKNNDPTRKKLAADTIEFYRKKSGVLVRLFGADTPISEVTRPERIRWYITARTEEGAKGTTIGKELTALSMAVKLAKKDGVDCALLADVKPEDFKVTYVPRERWLRREEYERFMSWWYANRDPLKGATLDFIVSTGATYPSEVARATRRDVRREDYWVHLRGTKRETRDRDFIVPSDRRDLFERALSYAAKSGPLFASWGNIRRDILIACAYVSMCAACRQAKNLWWYDSVNDSWAKGGHQVFGTPRRDPSCAACKKVEEMEPFCPTDLRRTFVQWLAQAGVPYEIIYPMTGHIDDRMLKKVYGKRSASQVAPLIEAVLAGGRPARRGRKLTPGSHPAHTQEAE